MLRPVQARRLAVEAREHLDRLSNRRDLEVKEALGLVLDAVAAMERELEEMQRRLLLGQRGVTLREQPVRIGGDGLWVGEKVEGAVLVHLGLRVAGAHHLVCAHAVGRTAPGGSELAFTDPDPSVRDLVVAFVFDQQRKERRRELDASART
ncbi:MAG TPA: hypothetical protein QGF58_08820 [Myxococcota bacterium]|nr:hypothetical protein [Myxococcota bacterium]